MTATKRSVPRRPQGLKARPQMTMTKEEFSEVCARIGLSIKEIAERLDLNRTTVHAYQTGRLEKVPTIVALAITMLEQEVEKEREANRRRLRRYGYSEEEQKDILAVLPSGLAMALVIPRKDGKPHDDGEE